MSQEDLHALVESFAQMGAEDDESSERLEVEIYRQLADGRPVSALSLAESLGRKPDDVTEALRELASSYIGFDDQDRVIEWAGFGLDGGNNRFLVRGSPMYAWCAWDALFVPTVIGEIAKVEATDPETGTSLSLSVTPDGVENADPSSMVMTFALPGMEAFPDFENFSFQRTTFFFESKTSALNWLDKNPGPAMISLEEGFAIGGIALRAWFPRFFRD